ncbi:hypothetical protein BDP55DRAFT_678440 [Colletotrichum godetiae]|uniref:Uncharacterized protein n=1 Tax=Colletotrichum godetiae TaxID=1209918 RepID=A0AAJ0ENG3_9PEZI|nr:uncharacterized protein BDP55DRAFT_678368 [Colletotrichum godetiae]XP_060424554.1 uncharacterized protein BDP55DRAFT_678440 [Colletotrichum godetiae]KAK1659759.1 hypothetical protein BDP55DRAFT_678368 [Colletotrichum godetiae]KAK1659790.1 hypothetical protein BDP55DRAFT_678440 [Colletotrichum godetiae]
MSLQHSCAVCHRARSESYHRKHPIHPGSEPLSGICRRCRSRRKEQVVVIHHYHNHDHIHHYYHYLEQPTDQQGRKHGVENPPSTAFELPGSSAAPFRAPSEVLADEPPPVVDMRTKPRMPLSNFR